MRVAGATRRLWVRIPPGPLMKPSLALAALLLCAASSAEFLAGFDSSSGKIWVLCENQSEVFVSGPQGATGRFALDTSHQASVEPQSGGEHVVQCGRETAAVQAFLPPEPQPLLAYGGYEAFALTALVLSLASIGIFLFAARFLLSQTYFCKEVRDGKARIILRAGPQMENVSIRDPVAIGCGEAELEFHIPLLPAGKEWEAEYEYLLNEENALPASLEAHSGGRKLSMLSILAAGRLARGGGRQEAKAAKRRIAKSD